MAKRVKAVDLQEMIRSIVRQEIKEVVSQTINEVLSERYLKKLAESVAVARPRGVASLEQMGEDAIEESPPRALGQSDEWPYRRHPMKHDDEIDEARVGDLQSLMFEGTIPIDQIEATAPSEDELTNRIASAQLPKGFENQKRVWTALAGVKKKPDDIDPVERAKFEEDRIKRQREALERKA